MNRFLFRLAFTCLIVAPLLSADMKLKTRMTAQGRSMETTKLVKGSRERSEMNVGPMTMVTIHQCDQQRLISLNDSTRTYMVTKLGTGETTETAKAAADANVRPARPSRGGGGVVTITMNSTDTGERKKMFGYTAKHIKTEMTTEATGNTCSGKEGNMKMTSDGWYIDLPNANIACTNTPQLNRPGMRGQGGDCQDEVRIRGNGMKMLGYPVSVDTTMTTAQGQTMSMKQEATDISTATLDAGLFEPPAGYREVSSYGEMMGMGNMAEMMRQAQESGRARARRSTDETVAASEGASSAAASGESDSSGRLRIGVITFGSATAQAGSLAAMRQRLIEQIQQHGAEAVELDVPASSSTADAEHAAREKDCHYFLYTVISSFKSPASKKKVGGWLAAAAGAGSSSDAAAFEVGLQYRLFAIGETEPKVNATAESKQGNTAEDSTAHATEAEATGVMVQVKKDEIRRRVRR